MNWNPYQTYVWTNAQVQQWIDTYGAWAFYNGVMWYIDVTPFRGVPSRKNVRFRKG